MFSGLMLSQYTSGALVCENRVLCTPAATGSIPAAADQEDFVSMGMTTALKTRQILDNAQAILAIEFIAAAQALDFRQPLKPSPAVEAARQVIRKHVAFWMKTGPFTMISISSKRLFRGEKFWRQWKKSPALWLEPQDQLAKSDLLKRQAEPA